jgi:hypothetical protein
MNLNLGTTSKTLPSYEVNWGATPNVIQNSYGLSGGYGAPVKTAATPTPTAAKPVQPVGSTKSVAPSSSSGSGWYGGSSGYTPSYGTGGSGTSYSTTPTSSGGGYKGFLNNFQPYTRTTSNNSGSSYRNSLLQQYAQMMIKAQNEANAANEKRYKEGMTGYQNIADMYAPGGSFGQGANAMYERGKTKNLATAGQNLISSGLGGTTISAGLPSKYEEEVGTPFKLQLQDLMTSKYAEAMGNKLGFLERKTEKGPDFSQIAQILASMG